MDDHLVRESHCFHRYVVEIRFNHLGVLLALHRDAPPILLVMDNILSVREQNQVAYTQVPHVYPLIKIAALLTFWRLDKLVPKVPANDGNLI